MPKKYRRNHNLKSIRLSRSYTITETAELIGVQNKAVYGWIKKGLPILEGSSPVRLHGSDIIAFHKNKRESQKQFCSDNQMFCCSCRQPRKVINHEIEIESRTSKIINFKGRCEVCNGRMNRTISPKKLEYFKQAFLSRKGQQFTLEGF
jgi:hypothetical protein